MGEPAVDTARLRRMEEAARGLAATLDAYLNGRASPPGIGFALLVFSFAGPELTWISNAHRGDMVKALEEILARFKAGTADELSEP